MDFNTPIDKPLVTVTGFRLPESQGASVSGEYPVLRPDAAPADEADRLRRVSGIAG